MIKLRILLFFLLVASLVLTNAYLTTRVYIKDSAKDTIALHTSHIRKPETMLLTRVSQYLQEQNINVIEFYESEDAMASYFIDTNYALKIIQKLSVSLVNLFYKPNAHIFLTHHVGDNAPYNSFNIIYIHMPLNLVDIKSIVNFDAYINLHKFANPDSDVLKNALLKVNKKNFIETPGYISCRQTAYYRNVNYNKIVKTGSLWGTNRGSDKIKNTLDVLEQHNYLTQYKFGAIKGGDEEFYKKIQEHGMLFIIHSGEHNNYGIPTSRICEGISSSALIISDHNPFVLKYFKDSALFYNEQDSSLEIYKTIKSHYEFATQNQEKVQKMTESAHKIFNENLAIEVVMPKIIANINDYCDQNECKYYKKITLSTKN